MPPWQGVEGHLVVSVNGNDKEWIFIPHDIPDSQTFFWFMERMAWRPWSSRSEESSDIKNIQKFTIPVSTGLHAARCTRRGQRLSSSRSSYVLLAYRRTRSQALITHHAKRPVRGVFYGSRSGFRRTYSAKPGSLQALGGRSSVSTSRSCSTKSCS